MPATSLFDIQINGFAGVDFQRSGLSPAALRKAVDGLAACETRRFFLTLITDAVPELCAKLENAERLRESDPAIGDAVCGYHIEGPWLSAKPGCCGAHDPRFMGPPRLSDFDRMQKAARGNIRLLTIAPELDGAEEFIREVSGRGVRVSLGHTDASCSQIESAIGAGARFCTHLGNGVGADLPRHDNVIQRLLARDELTAFFIPDGIHLPPFALKNLFRAKPPGKALFTTDCMAAAGAPAGRYSLAHHELEVGDDRVVRIPGTQKLAGSALTPPEGVANIIRWLGLDAARARALFSTSVAAEFGIELPLINNS